MSLNTAERKELTRLVVNNLDKNGKPLKEASTDDLQRIEALLGRDDGPSAPVPQQLKHHKISATTQALIEQGAKYLGCEQKNFGTEEKPRMMIREFLYRQGADNKQEAVMVQQDRVIVVGHKIADNALRRLCK